MSSANKLEATGPTSPSKIDEIFSFQKYVLKGINEIPVILNDRSFSEVNFASADTLEARSPTPVKSQNKLKKLYRVNKICRLSISQTTYLEVQPQILTSTSFGIKTEKSDEHMSTQCKENVAQVTSNENNENDNIRTIPDNKSLFVAPAMGPSDVFSNISRTKKIELHNMSSHLTTSNAFSTMEQNSNTDEKMFTILPENQSPVIISLKPSQTNAAQSQQSNIADISESDFRTAPELVTVTDPSTILTTDTNILCSNFTNNVLKKVATFTLEKSGSGISNGTHAAMHSENFNRRSTYVPEKLNFTSYEKFEGQMLVKWLISSLQNSGNNVGEQELNNLTTTYCSILLNAGVLKQISDDGDNTVFSPFQMYQWAHSELPASAPITHGKLDAVVIWPHCSAPTNQAHLTKGVQTEIIAIRTILQYLRNRLLTCTNMDEVKILANDLLHDEQTQRVSKGYPTVTQLFNVNGDTIFQYAGQEVDSNRIVKHKFLEVAVQTNITIENNGDTSQIFGYIDKLQNMIDRSVQTTNDGVNGENMSFKSKSANNIDIISKPLTQPSSINNMRPPPPPPPPPPPAPPPLPPPPPPPQPPPPTPSPAPVQEQSTAALIISSRPASIAQFPPPVSLLLNQKYVTVPPSQTISTSPAPLPSPAESEWFHQSNRFRKTAINPPRPMKPLYWTRIVTSVHPAKIAHLTESTDSDCVSQNDHVDLSEPKEIWQEIEETHIDNIDEFTELFSRQAVVPFSKPKEKKELRVKTIKLLDSKRSQNVGIFSRSLHVDFCEIEHAIYHVDTSMVSLETLQQIINIKATNEELELIKEAAQSDIPLDYPEQFLLKISQISMCTERISCIVFQAEFEEIATLITRKLESVLQLSQYLIESVDLKLIFSIILTLGNYMNGGNRQRGQADGFTLEILSKLKDVKSKESQTTLLHFIVRTYISLRRKEGHQLMELALPVPEPSDVERAAQVDFDEVKLQITELRKKLDVCKETTEKVQLDSSENTLQPFKSKIMEFTESASKCIEKLYKKLNESRGLFVEAMRFYHFTPKSRTLEQCTPDQFFEYWTNFTNDFKDIWKKEIRISWDDMLRKTKQIQTQSRKNVSTTKLKPGGLKERIIRLSKQ